MLYSNGYQLIDFGGESITVGNTKEITNAKLAEIIRNSDKPFRISGLKISGNEISAMEISRMKISSSGNVLHRFTIMDTAHINISSGTSGDIVRIVVSAFS